MNVDPLRIYKEVRKKYPQIDKLPEETRGLIYEVANFANSLGIQTLEERGVTPRENLRCLRLQLPVSQYTLAYLTDIARETIAAMEQNRRPISVTSAKRLAQALKCDHRLLL